MHDSVLNLCMAIGYKQETIGLCLGISVRWIEAVLLNKRDDFERRLHKIETYGYKLAGILIEAERSNWTHLSGEDLDELINMRAFLDSLQLFQSPHIHQSLFGANLHQGNIETISQLASSDAIQAYGGLVKIYSEPRFYSPDELTKYLTDLSEIMDSSESDDPIGMLLSGESHTIALSYVPHVGWRFMDINQYPSMSLKSSETSLLAGYILCGLHYLDMRTELNVHRFVGSAVNETYPVLGPILNNFASFDKSDHTSFMTRMLHKAARFLSKETLSFLTRNLSRPNQTCHIISTRILTTGNSPQLDPLKQKFKKFKSNYVLTEEIAFRKTRGTGLVHIAVKNDDVDVIVKLAKIPGVDFNQADNDGITPAYSAASYGHANVIFELAEIPGVNFNQANNDGITPAGIAASYGYANVIFELAKIPGVHFNQANNDGITPAGIAASHGHANVIFELAKIPGVNFNQADNDGITPACSAAFYGHANVIFELAKIPGVVFNQADGGITPAFIAAQRGHATVIKGLIRHSCIDLKQPYCEKAASLTGFSRNYGQEIISRMEKFIQEKPAMSDGRISITPVEIAGIMGHQKVVKLLKDADRCRVSCITEHSGLLPSAPSKTTKCFVSGSIGFFAPPKRQEGNDEKGYYEDTAEAFVDRANNPRVNGAGRE
jgi:ankyrin repeat protein